MSITMNLRDLWDDHYLRSINEQLRHSARVFRALGDNPYSRKSHHETVDIPSETVEAQRQFIEQWAALTALGYGKEWLYYGDDPDSPIELMTSNVTVVWDETDAEHKARLATLPATVTFEVR